MQWMNTVVHDLMLVMIGFSADSIILKGDCIARRSLVAVENGTIVYSELRRSIQLYELGKGLGFQMGRYIRWDIWPCCLLRDWSNSISKSRYKPVDYCLGANREHVQLGIPDNADNGVIPCASHEQNEGS